MQELANPIKSVLEAIKTPLIDAAIEKRWIKTVVIAIKMQSRWIKIVLIALKTILAALKTISSAIPSVLIRPSSLDQEPKHSMALPFIAGGASRPA